MGEQTNDETVISKRGWVWIVIALLASNGAQYLYAQKEREEYQRQINAANARNIEVILKLGEQTVKNADNALELAKISKQLLDVSTTHENLKDSLYHLSGRIYTVVPK